MDFRAANICQGLFFLTCELLALNKSWYFMRFSYGARLMFMKNKQRTVLNHESFLGVTQQPASENKLVLQFLNVIILP